MWNWQANERPINVQKTKNNSHLTQRICMALPDFMLLPAASHVL